MSVSTVVVRSGTLSCLMVADELDEVAAFAEQLLRMRLLEIAEAYLR